jgi:hypothetical protein
MIKESKKKSNRKVVRTEVGSISPKRYLGCRVGHES